MYALAMSASRTFPTLASSSRRMRSSASRRHASVAATCDRTRRWRRLTGAGAWVTNFIGVVEDIGTSGLPWSRHFDGPNPLQPTERTCRAVTIEFLDER